ncbi:hypothetical protein [Sphingomonas qomolangmaensis]|uniref:Uncharacterized protein n=1 Tax=Sphingomonas qomolangmaensis TaxID=2918765 RepID=A0ABY5L8M1_9SPHN|nr:hypothetical protein [Sphingomonas qomolangmaensis]UUL82301.1 hypothetical protein NMP03_14120 [Sphingomonas qomolangmaensis]
MAKASTASADAAVFDDGDPHYKQLQSAHEGYFQDVADICAKAQARYQTIQTEYERSVETAFLKQEPDGFRAANENYQRALESATADTSSANDYAEAYRRYKRSIKAMFGSVDIDELTFTDITQLSQSLFGVSQMALSLSCGQTATYNNPFEAATTKSEASTADE